MTLEEVRPDDAVGMGESLLPVLVDQTKKSEYLGYRVVNFSVREAMAMSGVSWRSVKRWRQDDAEFRALDMEGLTEKRKQLSTEFLNLEFTRNFHLILKKDLTVLSKATRGIKLDDQEHQYLLKIRSHYTPQQLVLIQELMTGTPGDKPFDYTRLVVTITKEKEEIKFDATQ